MLKTIFIVAEDPGGASALAPVIKLFQEQGVPLAIYCRGSAMQVFARQGIKYTEIPPTFSVDGATRLITEHRGIGLLAGTSMGADTADKIFLSAALNLGIFSCVLVDFWSNYRERFCDEHGQLLPLPQVIAVIDEMAKREAAREGLDRTRIYVTGQPAFDRLHDLKESFTTADRRAIRRGLEVEDDAPLILFASQPTAEICRKRFGDPDHIGYSEFRVLALLLDAVERIARRSEQAIKVIIRPHPTEELEKFDPFMSRYPSVRVSAEGDACKIALAADLIVGMDSEFLVETCLLEKVTVSLQPNLMNMEDSLPTNRLGISHAVYQPEEIEGVIEKMLFDPLTREQVIKRLTGLAWPQNASYQVLDLFLGCLNN